MRGDAEGSAAELRMRLEPYDVAGVAGRSRDHLSADALSGDGGRCSASRAIHERYRDELIGHFEFIRFNGRIGFAGLPLVRFTTEARLEAIMRDHEAMGAMVFNPHRYTLEEGGMKQTDAIQLAFKRETDPQGLLNPGKMIAFEDPNFDFSAGQNFLFPGLEARAAAARR